jgi:hypothetical protein
LISYDFGDDSRLKTFHCKDCGHEGQTLRDSTI